MEPLRHVETDLRLWIKALRATAGLTQQALANLVGVDRVTVARWETGDRIPSGARRNQLNDVARQYDIAPIAPKRRRHRSVLVELPQGWVPKEERDATR